MKTENEIKQKIKELEESACKFGKEQRCYMQAMENTKIEILKWVINEGLLGKMN